MTAAQVFLVANGTALLGWLALGASVLLGRHTLRDGLGRWGPLAFAILYSALLMFGDEAEGGFDSLENVQLLFRSPWVMVAGWVHYLAFDFFVGAWIAKQVMEEGRPRWILVLLLPLTFMLGPLGLLAHEASRWLWNARKLRG